jgi:hypothetical protein
MVDLKDKETGELWGKQNDLNFAYKSQQKTTGPKKKLDLFPLFRQQQWNRPAKRSTAALNRLYMAQYGAVQTYYTYFDGNHWSGLPGLVVYGQKDITRLTDGVHVLQNAH